MPEDIDNIDSMERQDTKMKLPLGWLLLLAGLSIWGVFYMINYTPQISGWTQESAYLDSLK
jgi:hypothetical protein